MSSGLWIRVLVYRPRCATVNIDFCLFSRLSSAGLVYAFYGEDVIKTIAPEESPLRSEDLKIIYKKVRSYPILMLYYQKNLTFTLILLVSQVLSTSVVKGLKREYWLLLYTWHAGILSMVSFTFWEYCYWVHKCFKSIGWLDLNPQP